MYKTNTLFAQITIIVLSVYVPGCNLSCCFFFFFFFFFFFKSQILE